MFQIKDKVALVTGSTAGFGRELAFQLCALGAKVILNGRDLKRLEKTASEFHDAGFQVALVTGDVSDPEECRKIIDHCIVQFDRLDILISNAGLGSGGKFSDTTPETFRKVFEVNTLGTIYLTRFALPHIQETKGTIIFISSLAGLLGLPYSSLYSSSKMALTAIAQSLQVEWKGTGVHIGIAYVGFLKNSEDKRVLGPTGELQPTGERKTFRLQPMEKASRAIIRQIQKRKRKMILSTMGKTLSVALRFSPWLIRIILMNNQKRARKIYEPGN